MWGTGMGVVTVMTYWGQRGHMDNGWGIVMIVWIIRSTSTPTPPVAATGLSAAGSVTASAEQILAERLARGDIDPEEYSTRLEALTSRGTR